MRALQRWLRLLRTKRRFRDEAGYVLLTSALLVLPLMAATGLAVDVGSWYSTGIQVQRAADAAALAGVVWLPDRDKAEDVALETATRNGYSAGGDITVVVLPVNSRQLRVTITAPATQYFSGAFVRDVTITRTALAEYVLPVPLGSPRNYFGTGNLQSGSNYEGFWASINNPCTPREQGDAFAVRFAGSWPIPATSLCPRPWGPGPDSAGGSSYVEVNEEHIANPDPQYEYYIEVPSGRSQSIYVLLYDAAKFNPGQSPDLGGNVPVTTTFTLRAPDGTPLDDTDNPVFAGCTGAGEPNPRTFGFNGADWDVTVFGTNRWTRFCSIPTSAPSGLYILDVNNLDGEGSMAGPANRPANVNNYAVMASPGLPASVCDTRTSSTCPGVYGKEWISIYAAANSRQAAFYLAEIEALHAGKEMVTTLFDPGEGGNYIQLLDPNGSPVSFSWETQDGDYSGGPTDRLDVSGCTGRPQVGPHRQSQCRFNERFVDISFQLPLDYETRFGSSTWWRIRYNFNASVTDRTTWSAQVLGDPVRLVE